MQGGAPGGLAGAPAAGQPLPVRWCTYAVLESANDCLKALYLAGVDLRAPCDKYGASPRMFALAQANDEAAELIDKMLLPVEQKPWKCKGCSVENEPAAEFCQLCGEPCGPNPERVMVPH